ncbi:PqqD family protein [Neobacillus ginsengisoli]|uniref:PqqD family protein n=1 Tax=Neobacillus ginsengisoli TaxID=904295 RepID=A0ABT9XTU1_9BACI|nr:PqqD family protein [Neobacillus ginsengisoli]MDQ0198766.1 hypothetical protein [Neobacillus ginsengisoli]
MMKYIQKGKYEATELDGEWIILNTEDYTVTKLNEVGGICWSLLGEVQTSETLTHSLMEKFSPAENEEQIKKDLEEFLSSLHQCGLIENVN